MRTTIIAGLLIALGSTTAIAQDVPQQQVPPSAPTTTTPDPMTTTPAPQTPPTDTMQTPAPTTEATPAPEPTPTADEPVTKSKKKKPR